MSDADFIDPSKEKVYLFVDYANTYREAIKQHNPEAFANQQSGDCKTTTTQSSPNFNSATMEQALAKLLKSLKKSKNSDEAVKNIVPNLFDLLACANSLEDCKRMKNYRSQLLTADGRKAFMQDHFSVPRFVLQSDNLVYICTRFKLYEELPKKQCYFFVSHSPGDRESLETNDMFTKMAEKFQVLYHERVHTQKKFQKEKGVDVNIAVHITDLIGKARDPGQHIRIVLVSGDADFKPVIEYAIQKKVQIDIWCWKSTLSRSYKSFLQKQKVQLFFLDRYLYQIGFHKEVIFEYEFQIFLTTALLKAEREEMKKIYRSISHYALAKRLTEETDELGFVTSDFEIFWSGQGFTIAFFREESRNKFEKFLNENPDDEIAQKLNKLQRQKTLYSTRVQSDKSREQLFDWAKEDEKAVSNLVREDDTDSDSDTNSEDDDTE